MEETPLLDPEVLEKVINLAKRRGFVFPSAEIYGGFRSTYDYGPLGVNMLRNVKQEWWRAMVQRRTDIVGLDAAILGPPAVWAASGHLETFTRPARRLPGLQGTLARGQDQWRMPELWFDAVHAGARVQSDVQDQAGPVEGEGSTAYLRPETAQGMFTNFLNVLTTTRKKPPFGIAQVGKSFRNEITPQNFVFRTREFEQMEMEYFVPPTDAEEWYRYWIDARRAWYLDLGIPEVLLRLHEHAPEDLSHYSKGTTDIEFFFPWGWDELEGVANRGDYDLSQHTKFSGVALDYFDQTTNERYTPYVIEPAAGATRAMMAFLISAYHEDVIEGETRSVLRLDWRLAPYQVAVLPLSKKPELEGVSSEVLATAYPALRVRL